MNEHELSLRELLSVVHLILCCKQYPQYMMTSFTVASFVYARVRVSSLIFNEISEYTKISRTQSSGAGASVQDNSQTLSVVGVAASHTLRASSSPE